MSSSLLNPAQSTIDRWVDGQSWTILRTKLTIHRHQLRVAFARHPGRIALQTFVVIPVLILVGIALFVGLASGLSAAATPDEATAMLATLLTMSAVTAFIGSSTTALQSLYLSNDLSFLLTLPIPFRVLFAEKFIAAMAGTIPGALFGLVSLAAYGSSRGEHSALIPVAVIAWLMVVILATTISVVTVALVTRSIPARRARLALLGISLTIVGLTVLLWNAITPSQQHLGMGGSDQTIVQFGKTISWFPTAWLAQAVSDAGSGRLGSASRTVVDTLVLTVISVVGAYQIFARTFAHSVAATRATPDSRSSQRQVERLQRLIAPLPQGIGAIVLKEWLTIFRDLKRLSGVIWPLGVVAIYGISASRSADLNQTQAFGFWQENAALALLPWGVSLGLSIFAFGAEQRAIHLLRLMPIGPRRLFAGKTIAAAIPVLLFSEIVAVIVAQANGASIGELAGIMVLVAWATAGFVSIDTAAAAFAPNFEADHIQRSTTLVGRVFGMVMGAGFALMTGLAATRLILYSDEPPLEFRDALAWEVASIHPLGALLVIFGLLAALGTVFVAVAIAINRLDDLIRNGP